MNELSVALIIFACLAVSSLGSLAIHGKLPARYLGDDTQAVIRLIAGIFSVMTSLVLGLMINSAKNTLESVDRNVHIFAADLIVLDRRLIELGPEAGPVRDRLREFAKQATRGTKEGDRLLADRSSEVLFNDVVKDLKSIRPTVGERFALWESADHQLRKLAELRWIIVGQSESTIPAPIIFMLVSWLMLIFASFGYRAPKNAVVVGSLLLSSFLISGAIYLIVDMDAPFTGPIQVSRAPLERAIAEMQK